MYRLPFDLGLALLLALSLAIKVHALGQNAAIPAVDDQDIVSLLGRKGFAVSRAAANTDPGWIYGVKGRCKVQVADVSLQGWHRATLEWEAGGRSLLYSVGGMLYAEQPILKPMVIHYFRRFERYVGVQAPSVRVRAIIIDPQCPPNQIAPAEFEALS